jgi:hypothetical protein
MELILRGILHLLFKAYSYFISFFNKKYLFQKEGSCCALFALVNALRYYNKYTPSPGTKEWEELIDLIKCRNGAALRTKFVADYLGLKIIEIDINKNMIISNLPVLLCVIEPENKVGLHATLVISGDKKSATLVNYRWKSGPAIEKIFWEDIMFPGIQHCRAWSLKLKD